MRICCRAARNNGRWARAIFTLWMGSIHNIPNYAAVGGFIFLGLSPLQVMLAVVLSSFIVATFMNLNGVAGSKYGIPFAMHTVTAVSGQNCQGS